jgi:hypothetical protein
MRERQISSSASFVDGYTRSYPSSVSFVTDTHGNTVDAYSSRDFQTSRAKLLTSVFEGKPRHEVMSHVLIAERIVALSLQPVFEDAGFRAVLAPQTLERGGEQKGVDLIVSDPDNMTYLGIDVKLRSGTSPYNRDGYGWSPSLKSPYIYLSLGNWSTEMREKEEVTVKDWLADFAIPKIQQTGKIPKLHALRQYLIGRMERSLSGYRERLLEPNEGYLCFGLPKSKEDREILEEKVGIMHSLFADLQIHQ